MRLRPTRKGAILPLFAILLPVLVILCAFAINVAYMQVTRTELKIATDASARAGGRAWSVTQDVGTAAVYARKAASQNFVGGKRFKIRNSDISFGSSVRANNGKGRYEFVEKPRADVASGSVAANSIQVFGDKRVGSSAGPVQLLLSGIHSDDRFQPVTQSICTQLDRDIALVLDRSGSMVAGIYDHDMLEYLHDLRLKGKITLDDLVNASYGTKSDFAKKHYPEVTKKNLYARKISRRLQWQLRKAAQTDPVAQTYREYCYDIGKYTSPNAASSKSPAPRHSRWALLCEAVQAFTDVLLDTDQEELVSLGTFASQARLDVMLTDGTFRYEEINKALQMRPYGGTAIGRGLQATLPSLVGSGSGSRPFAKKTVVVLSDGKENTGIGSQGVAKEIVAGNDVVIHTVTFSPGADQKTMKSVADIGGGKHYHANDGNSLIEIFREIANNLPTIMTD